MNEEYNEEDFLQDDTSTEDNISYDQDTTLEDKLDHIEALLNEDITLRIQEEELVTSSGVEEVTSSGVNVPDYSQYIYDLLSDSSIKVEIVGDTITEKQLNDYSVIESIGLIGLIIGFICVGVAFINKYTFKRR